MLLVSHLIKKSLVKNSLGYSCGPSRVTPNKGSERLGPQFAETV